MPRFSYGPLLLLRISVHHFSCLFSKVNDDLNTLISVLESPVFQSILNIQDSLKELKKQVGVFSNWAVVTLYS